MNLRRCTGPEQFVRLGSTLRSRFWEHIRRSVHASLSLVSDCEVPLQSGTQSGEVDDRVTVLSEDRRRFACGPEWISVGLTVAQELGQTLASVSGISREPDALRRRVAITAARKSCLAGRIFANEARLFRQSRSEVVSGREDLPADVTDSLPRNFSAVPFLNVLRSGSRDASA